MLDLAMHLPAHSHVEQMSAKQEAMNGADWEWWLTDGKEWLGLLVQAKIVNPRNERYTKLNYKSRKAPKPQLAMLIDSARTHSLCPIVLCYNFQTMPNFQWNCCQPRYDPLYGCSVILAPSAHTCAQTKQTSIKQVSRDSWPLFCLVGCHAHGGLSLPARALMRIRAAGGEIGEGLRQSPPRHVREILARRRRAGTEKVLDDDESLATLRARKLGGILILNGSDELDISEL